MVEVSRSSVSHWVRDIELTPEQHASLRARNPAYNGQRVGQAVRSARARELRRIWQDEGRRAALVKDPFHAAACMLYWAEGAKHRNTLKISNADAEVLRFFVRFLRTEFGLPDELILLRCQLFADHLDRQFEIERYWLDVLELPRTSLRTSTVNVYSKYSAKKRVNRLPYGTCHLSVHRTAVVQHIYGAIQEYAGFERPEWLD
jgi:hypothetical protein